MTTATGFDPLLASLVHLRDAIGVLSVYVGVDPRTAATARPPWVISLELGIDLDRDPEEVQRWALAAPLFGNRISTTVAMRTYRVLQQAGVGRSKMRQAAIGRSSSPFSPRAATSGTTSARHHGFSLSRKSSGIDMTDGWPRSRGGREFRRARAGT